MGIDYISIAAYTKNHGIGINNEIPWPYIKYDMKRFKELTMGNVIVFGSKTYMSLSSKHNMVCHLSGRYNVVFTRNKENTKLLNADLIVSSMDEFDMNIEHICKFSNRIFICGGSEIYKLFNSRITHIYHTEIITPYKCDKFYVDIPKYNITRQSKVISDNDIKYRFIEGVTENGRCKDMIQIDFPNIEEIKYQRLLDKILKEGEKRDDRTGIGTKSISSGYLEFNLEDDTFPLLTTKKMFLRGVAEELIWFLSGKSYNTDYLISKNVHIWDANSTREYLDRNNLHKYRIGELGPEYGFIWRHFGAKYVGSDHDYSNEGYDQICEVIRLIKSDPNSRRILFTGWEPTQLKHQALPSCHILYMFYVHTNGKLDCHMIQRSCDSFLGLPFNIASTALLTYLIAKVTNKRPGKIRLSFNDIHIYNNHIEAVREQLKREPYKFPKIRISDISSLEEFSWEKVEIINYICHDPIKADIAA